MAHSPKHGDAKQHERNVQPRDPGRDYHSSSQKQVRDGKEGPKSDHKGKGK